MHVKNATEQALKEAANAVGVRINGPTPSRGGYRFTLRTDGYGPELRYGRRSFRRNRDGSRRRVPGAVCWHGHRDFMHELFARCPDAVLVTALATYRGRADFEAKFPATYWRKSRAAGVMFMPEAPEALPCDCDE